MKTLVAGWFSFEDGHATAGDLLACELVCQWLAQAGHVYDVAFAPPFAGGVDWRTAYAEEYSHALFLCGPFGRGEEETAFLLRFARCRLLGLNLSMCMPLEAWNPFDHLIERDSSVHTHADMVFLSRQPLRPVVGVCLVEPHPEARVDVANAAISRLLASQAVCPVQIDTRLDSNETGLASPADVETLIARMDVLVTTRLHGMVLALKNGVPVVAVDAVPGGGKIQRQAEKIGWSTVLTLDRLTDQSLQQALAESLTPAARAEAAACAERARALAEEVRNEFLAAMARSAACEENYQARMTPHGRQRFVDSLRLSPSALWPWVSRLSLARRLLPSLMRVGRAVLPLPALRWLRWCSASASFKPPSAR